MYLLYTWLILLYRPLCMTGVEDKKKITTPVTCAIQIYHHCLNVNEKLFIFVLFANHVIICWLDLVHNVAMIGFLWWKHCRRRNAQVDCQYSYFDAMELSRETKNGLKNSFDMRFICDSSQIERDVSVCGGRGWRNGCLRERFALTSVTKLENACRRSWRWPFVSHANHFNPSAWRAPNKELKRIPQKILEGSIDCSPISLYACCIQTPLWTAHWHIDTRTQLA